MLRALLFWVKLAVLVGAAWYLAEANPGRVALDWWGYRIETSVGVLILAAALLAAVAAVIYRTWGGLRRAPRDIGRSLATSKQRRGYRALTQGMVAVAAGEAEEARRWARKADDLLDEPPLTMLLSAQAAQLGGDNQAAKRYFTAMLERDETRFLGLRGLITQALREGDEAAALEHVRAAYALRPKTPWVLTTLFDLSERAGDLEGAERALREAARHKALPAPEARRRRGVLLLERALASQREPNRAETVKLARQAHEAAPGLVPATVLHARLLAASGRQREAARLLEKAWAGAPHPDLVAAYRAARPGKSGIEWLTQLGKLVAGAPEHPESRLALAEAALDARLWGEARRYLGAAAADGPSERVCRLMARLEEAEHGDGERAREWLMRAGEAEPDPAWVCGACGAVAGEWTARCGACEAYDSLAWRSPPRVAARLAGPEAAGAPARAAPAALAVAGDGIEEAAPAGGADERDEDGEETGAVGEAPRAS